MALYDEEIRIILNTADSSSQAYKLAQEVRNLKDDMTLLSNQFNEGTIAEASFRSGAERLTGSLRDRSEVLETVARSTGILGEHGANMGRTMLQASYAVQDFSSQIKVGLAPALASIQNNIPGILAGLGAGPGLAGIISVVSVAAGLALPKIKDFFGAISDENVKEATKALEEMQKKFEAFQNAPSPEAAETEKGMGEFLKGQGKGVSSGILNQMRFERMEQLRAKLEAQLGPEDELKTNYGRMLFRLGMSHAEGMVEEETGTPEAPGKMRKEMMRLTTTLGDPSSQREILGLASRAGKGVFPRDFLESMQSMLPEAGKAADAELQATIDFGDAATRGGEGRRRNARELNERRKKVEERQKKEDESIRQQGDMEDKEQKDDEKRDADFRRDIRQAGKANLKDDARRQSDLKKALRRFGQEAQQTASLVGSSNRLMQETAEKNAQWAMERNIAARNPGQSGQAVSEVAKRTLDLVGRNINVSLAMATAEAEYKAKVHHLEGRMTDLEQAAQHNRNAHPTRMGKVHH